MDQGITKNFSIDEFRCKGLTCCGHAGPISIPLVKRIQNLRDTVSELLHKDTPIKINSGFRCPRHNAETEGSSPTSAHMYGVAADLAVPKGLTVTRFAEIARLAGFKKVIEYTWGIHVDDRWW